MDQWEYMSIVIATENKQYVMTQGDGSKVYGLDDILNYWSPGGWELVTIFPSDFSGGDMFNSVSIYATRLTATFKRRQAPIDPYNLPS